MFNNYYFEILNKIVLIIQKHNHVKEKNKYAIDINLPGFMSYDYIIHV